MEERALFSADVDERGLNAGKYCFDPSEVDVADHSARLGTVDQKFNELVVLDDGDPRFSRVRVDQNLSFHRCPARSPAPGDSAGRAWRNSKGVKRAVLRCSVVHGSTRKGCPEHPV